MSKRAILLRKKKSGANAAGRFMVVLPGTALRYLRCDEVLLQDHVYIYGRTMLKFGWDVGWLGGSMKVPHVAVA